MFTDHVMVIHVHHDLIKTTHNFSLEWVTIFLSAPFSAFPFFFVYVKFQSIAPVLSYSIIMY